MFTWRKNQKHSHHVSWWRASKALDRESCATLGFDALLLRCCPKLCLASEDPAVRADQTSARSCTWSSWWITKGEPASKQQLFVPPGEIAHVGASICIHSQPRLKKTNLTNHHYCSMVGYPLPSILTSFDGIKDGFSITIYYNYLWNKN